MPEEVQCGAGRVGEPEEQQEKEKEREEEEEEGHLSDEHFCLLTSKYQIHSLSNITNTSPTHINDHKCSQTKPTYIERHLYY